MKVLITGCNGFVGSYLCAELLTHGYVVLKSDLHGNTDVIPMNILDIDEINKVLVEYKPDVLVNIAGQANVGESWKKPQFTFQLNVIGVINILESVKRFSPSTKVITIGSSDEYGCIHTFGNNVTEDVPLNPRSPYAISKCTQEYLSKLYKNSFDLDCSMIRMFNLGGAGQMKGFMISDFSSEIASVEAGKQNSIHVGNLESFRDFTHVKDACKAIRLIIEKGHSGEVYNVCSGKTYKTQYILDKLLKMAKIDISIVQDPSRMRPSDIPVICGNHQKLSSHTGWQPTMSIDDILEDALNYWRLHI